MKNQGKVSLKTSRKQPKRGDSKTSNHILETWENTAESLLAIHRRLTDDEREMICPRVLTLHREMMQMLPHPDSVREGVEWKDEPGLSDLYDDPDTAEFLDLESTATPWFDEPHYIEGFDREVDELMEEVRKRHTSIGHQFT